MGTLIHTKEAIARRFEAYGRFFVRDNVIVEIRENAGFVAKTSVFDKSDGTYIRKVIINADFDKKLGKEITDPARREFHMLGLEAHELLHQIFTPFDEISRRERMLPPSERKNYHRTQNACQDYWIEAAAPVIFAGAILASLIATISYSYESTPNLETLSSSDGHHIASEVCNALIMVGDRGPVKGHFSCPEAEEVFNKVLPLFEQIGNENDAIRVVDLSDEIFAILRPYFLVERDSRIQERSEMPEGRGNGSDRPEATPKVRVKKPAPEPEPEPESDEGEGDESGEEQEGEEEVEETADEDQTDEESGNSDEGESADENESFDEGDSSDTSDDPGDNQNDSSNASSGDETPEENETGDEPDDDGSDDESGDYEAEDESGSEGDGESHDDSDTDENAPESASDGDTEEEDDSADEDAGNESDVSTDSSEGEEDDDGADDELDDETDESETEDDTTEDEESEGDTSEEDHSSDTTDDGDETEDDEADESDEFDDESDNEESDDVTSKDDADTSKDDSENSDTTDGEDAADQDECDRETSDDDEGNCAEEHDDGCGDGDDTDPLDADVPETPEPDPFELTEDQIREAMEDTARDLDREQKELEREQADENNDSEIPSGGDVKHEMAGPGETWLYNLLLRRCEAPINVLEKKLKAIIKGDRGGKQYASTGGHISVKRLASGELKKDIKINRTAPKQCEDMQVHLLVDESGSMEGAKECAARECAIILYEAFLRLGIKVAVTGFTTMGYDVVSKHYTTEKTPTSAKISLTGISSGDCNCDAHNIEAEVEDMLKRYAAHRLLIVISDGAPCQMYGDKKSPEDLVHDAVTGARNRGIDVMAVAIQPGSRLEYAEMYGKDFVWVYNTKDLAPQVIKVMTDIVRRWRR